MPARRQLLSRKTRTVVPVKCSVFSVAAVFHCCCWSKVSSVFVVVW